MAGTDTLNMVVTARVSTISMRVNAVIGNLTASVEAIFNQGKAYHGEYEITPSREEQILPTAGSALSQDIVVHAIPQNYGLITYNGFEIMVS